ncbi:ABC transporter substrate-binding protein [Kribbella sp.]|uniref:ABC transporter substrate-binding protein n=1 Tax=Kribbella sp. TaxID=1871183 RepID=UPI002D71ADBC|nr:ABC transporter substrate-binding protein [Kribbella sp.]HZX03083.1 ABC transporter substrate-binding protein [Kribbella sp.]
MTTLKLSSMAHGLNYLPEYVARGNGIFAANGLAVPYTLHDPWDGMMHALADGTADVALGGVWVPAMYSGRGRDFVAIAQLNDRFPMCIVTRERVDGFELSWLRDRTILVPGQGGTAPAEFTRGLMREAGLDPWQTRFAHDLSMPMLSDLYVGGLGDAFLTDLVTALELQRAGRGHLAYLHAERGGRMPNSVYYVLRERLEELTPALIPFVRSIDQAMQQLRDGNVTDLNGLFAAEWPAADPSTLLAATELLIKHGVWNTARVDRDALERWTGILHTAGLTVDHVKYDDIIDTRAMLE